jgi:PAS domain S-box-containing protein
MTEKLDLFLIEDDDDVALLMQRCLERTGHEVKRCRTAAGAIIVLAQSRFDLVLLDRGLPDMENGEDLLEHMARENIHVPVLMVTGRGDEQLAARVLRGGVLDYIVKDSALTWLIDLPKRVSACVNRYRLEQTNRLLIQALESAGDGIMITDLRGVIRHVNQALLDLTGYARAELLGGKPSLLKSGAHPPELYKEMWRAVLNRESWQGELTNRRKDGSLFEASLTISPILDHQGRLTHFVGIQRDITAHKQLERQVRQSQKMQSVGTLAGGVAHEFNNLLAGISGYASLGLREPGVSPVLRGFMENIVDLAERAALLTRQLLAFARKPALLRRPTSMTDLVRSTAELVSRSMHQGISLELPERTPSAPALLVEADGNQLQQAIINLALNARDAMKEGEPGERKEPLIHFRLRGERLSSALPAFPQSVPPGDYVVVEVEDHGCGMTPPVLAQALDPFFTTKEVGQGTGLGLPVVFGIVQGHQGFLTIRSEPGSGSCFSLYLPRLAESAQAPPPEAGTEEAEVLEPETSTGFHILVVDDEEAVLDVVERFLKIAGHQVTCVTSGATAVERLQQGEAADLVILDLMMPRENGAVTFLKLREVRPGLPVLLCTGLIRDDGPAELLNAGAAGLLRKPFRMTELWYAVRQALGQESGVTRP